MRFDIVTLFEDMFPSFLDSGILGRARVAGLVTVGFVNPRDFTSDKHRTVDDAPYGGGGGMVLRPGPFVDAIESVKPAGRTVKVLLTPQGAPFRQAHARDLHATEHAVLVCGRYEGFDDRIRKFVDLELSIGDFVILGGEVAAMAVIEAVTRLVPGVLGNEASPESESHVAALLEYPHYTRPATFRGIDLPEVLRSGDHGAIERWRRKESLRRTRERRPDLLADALLTEVDRELLRELDAEGVQK